MKVWRNSPVVDGKGSGGQFWNVYQNFSFFDSLILLLEVLFMKTFILSATSFNSKHLETI